MFSLMQVGKSFKSVFSYFKDQFHCAYSQFTMLVVSQKSPHFHTRFVCITGIYFILCPCSPPEVCLL